MDFDFIIIGAGSVGLSAAEMLSSRGLRILVIEKESRIGTGVSSRNSEVIHAGIYYPKDSLKSKLCIRGRQLLYEWCSSNNVPHRKTGKFIIAVSNDELDLLDKVRIKAHEAGLAELYPVTAAEVMAREPEVFCTGGLWSPETGIISAHEYMDSLKIKASEQGCDFLFNSVVTAAERNSQNSAYIVSVKDSSGEIAQVETGGVINCAGLYCDKVAGVLGIYDESYRIRFVKGNYFRLTGSTGVFKHLIYPVPDPGLSHLGVHVTIDLNGRARFGPDVEDLPGNVEDYSVDENRKESFYNSIRTYYPAVSPERLQPDMAGIRPRLAAGMKFRDFIINEESERGRPGIINCIAIESPGLTASRAISEYLMNMCVS